MLGMLLLDQRAGHLMFGIPLPITLNSPPPVSDNDIITEVSSYFAGRGTDHYIFRVVSESETPFCTLSTVISVLNTNLSVHLIHSIRGPPTVRHVITCTGRWPPSVWKEPLTSWPDVKLPLQTNKQSLEGLTVKSLNIIFLI